MVTQEGEGVQAAKWANGGRCLVQVKVAMSRVRLRVILRSPDLGCVSLPGLGRLAANNVACDGAARGVGPAR
jgi:hypothetical protein